MNQLPDRLPTYVGQPQPLSDETAKERARQIAAAVDEVLAEQKTFHRDDTPLPAVGTAPPVPQPGRPPMSQSATDASALMLSGSVLTLAVGGTGSLVMYASGYADPVVCGLVFGAPAVLVLAISRLVRRAKEVVEAAPATHHHHYSGSVHQQYQTVTNQNRWLGKTTNNL